MTRSVQQKKWAIVGGGMCGMTLALRLAEAGHQVSLFESGFCLGGLASAWELGNITWDRHYHVTLLSDGYTRRILKDIGLAESIRWCVTRTGYFSGRELVGMSNIYEYLRLPGLGLLQKMRLAWTILHASRIRSGDDLEKVPLQEWLCRHSGRRVFEKLWRPLLRAKLGDRYDRCSAAFLWATIRRLYAARESGLKTEKFGYVEGGYASVTKAFEQRLIAAGVKVYLQTPVKCVGASQQQLLVESALGQKESFDCAVVTLSPRRAAALCQDLQEPERQCLEAVAYQGLICASLLLEKPLADYYLTYLLDENLPFTAVVEMSSMVDCTAFGGQHLVYLPLYLAADDPRFCLSDEEIQSSFLQGLKKIYPNFREQDLCAFRVSRVPEVFPLPVLNYSKTMPAMDSSIPGLYFVSAAQIKNGTLNVNETIALAEHAAEVLA